MSPLAGLWMPSLLKRTAWWDETMDWPTLFMILLWSVFSSSCATIICATTTRLFLGMQHAPESFFSLQMLKTTSDSVYHCIRARRPTFWGTFFSTFSTLWWVTTLSSGNTHPSNLSHLKRTIEEIYWPSTQPVRITFKINHPGLLGVNQVQIMSENLQHGHQHNNHHHTNFLQRW